MSRKKIAREAGLILGAAVLLGAAANALRSESYKLAWVQAHAIARREAVPPQVEQTTQSPPSDSGALYTEITPEVAFRMYGAGALFLDARRTAAYEAGHIAGARSIPVWEHDADTRIDALRGDGVSFDKDIVV